MILPEPKCICSSENKGPTQPYKHETGRTPDGAEHRQRAMGYGNKVYLAQNQTTLSQTEAWCSQLC